MKLFGEGTNSLTNDSSLAQDEHFFDKTKRRQNGWYSFYELFGDTNERDPAGGNKILKVGFPPVNVQSGNWDSEYFYWKSLDANNPYDQVEGSWAAKNTFEEQRLGDPSTSQSLNIDVKANQICLNACDKYAIYGIMQQPFLQADYVRFIICDAVLRSPSFGGEDDNDIKTTQRERQIQLLPTDKITFGGNILRSPKKVHAHDMINPEQASGNNEATALESLQIALRNTDSGADEGITVLSAGYPAIIQPSAIFRDVQFDATSNDTVDPIINPVSQADFEGNNLDALSTKPKVSRQPDSSR